ncbi:MAG: hypothetical protein ACK57G_11920 [Planctomycetota bacterium]
MAKIRPSGGYRELRGFQAATAIYDATYCCWITRITSATEGSRDGNRIPPMPSPSSEGNNRRPDSTLP